MQRSSPKLITAGALFAVLGLGLTGWSSGPEAGVYSQSPEAGAFRYTKVRPNSGMHPKFCQYLTLSDSPTIL